MKIDQSEPLPVAKRQRWRWLSWRRLALVAAVLVVLFVVVPLAIVGYPDPAFPFQVEVGNLSLRSDAPISNEIAETLAEVEARLRELEINDPELRHRLFLCSSAKRYAFFTRVLGVSANSQGVNAPLVHSIFLSQTFLDSMQARFGERYRYSLLEGDLAHIATHEIVHTLVTKRLGFFASRRLPHWKREGYPEYASVAPAMLADLGDDLVKRLERFAALRRENLGPIRTQYARAQLLVEYLMSVEGWDFERLVSSEIAPDEVFRDLEGWAASAR